MVNKFIMFKTPQGVLGTLFSIEWLHCDCFYEYTTKHDYDRIKIYVNGVQETSLETAKIILHKIIIQILTQMQEHTIGKDVTTNNKFHGGYMAEVYFVDGLQLGSTYFGKFNSNGIWVFIEKGKGAGGSISFGGYGFTLNLNKRAQVQF